MKISQVISQLKQILVKEGDLNCSVYLQRKNATIAPVNKLTVLSDEDGEVVSLLLHHSADLVEVENVE